MNIDSYYEGLASFVNHATSEGFIRETHRKIMVLGNNPADLLTQLENYKAPQDIVSMIQQGKKE